MRLLIVALASAAIAAAATCEQLTSLTIPDTTILSADEVPAKPAVTGRPATPAIAQHCRVLAVSHPVPDSEIHFELWLPPAGKWNGKFEGTGNGGFSSAIEIPRMAQALDKGYATAGSDTGHEGGEMTFGVGHPEKINDWAYRAVHVMTEKSRLIVRDYYGSFARYSYFNGCSTGGQQALSEAQRYPEDYDGIVAGDPANNRIHLITAFLWAWSALYKDNAADLPASKLPMITKAVVAACGAKDGYLEDPRTCRFDPAVLECKGADSETCLTAPQVQAVKKIYDGPKNPRTGERILAGFPRGSETGWGGYFVGQKEASRADFWKLWLFHDPNWDWKTFDYDKDLAWADKEMPMMNALDTNLTPFKSHGGKLVMYHGWADPVVPPEDGVRYYEAVEKRMGGPEKTTDFYRLFMVPGMGHCAGGPGPNQFDAVEALDTWVTKKQAPAQLIATHATQGKVDRTRPLCPYPQVARYKGTGDTNEAANFTCALP